MFSLILSVLLESGFSHYLPVKIVPFNSAQIRVLVMPEPTPVPVPDPIPNPVPEPSPFPDPIPDPPIPEPSPFPDPIPNPIPQLF